MLSQPTAYRTTELIIVQCIEQPKFEDERKRPIIAFIMLAQNIIKRRFLFQVHILLVIDQKITFAQKKPM